MSSGSKTQPRAGIQWFWPQTKLKTRILMYINHIERSIAKANPLNYFPIILNSLYTNETRGAISKCIEHANSRSFAYVTFGHLWRAKCPTHKGLKGIARGLRGFDTFQNQLFTEHKKKPHGTLGTETARKLWKMKTYNSFAICLRLCVF